jgi:pSer/pThr/pTyr-binding forkhead associated (FHA) protein
MAEIAPKKTICSQCSHENAVGVLICRRCYTPLVTLSTGDSTRDIQLPNTMRSAGTGQLKPSTGQLKPTTGMLQRTSRLRLRVPKFQAEIEFDISSRNAMIGREDRARGIIPNIDLGTYDAVENGISRCHALFQRQGNRAYVVDLKSSNGTFVNGNRLRPHMPQRLGDSDIIRFGKLESIIYFI